MDFLKVLEDLEKGNVRAILREGDSLRANSAVKEAILAAIRAGKLQEMAEPTEGRYVGFVEKDTLLPRKFRVEDKIRFVPGGSSVRRGAYLAPGVIVMPPSYINIGAYIDEGTMVDSHVLVGSCAQIGKRVHLSAGVQIGGVLEPVNAQPVVIEDDSFLGANCVVVEGIRVGTRAVLAPGVVLSKGVSVYDAVNEKILERGAAIPPNAVVVPGARPMQSAWAKAQGLSVHCPVIIKYRDEKSDASLVLEEALR